MTQTGLQVLVEDEGFLFGRMHALAVLLWFRTPTAQRVRQVAERLPELAKGGGVAILTVVTPACAPVGADVRSIFDEALRANRDALLGTATVIQVEGVLGGLTRAIGRAMAIVSRVPYPNNVYATVADASRWIPQILSSSGQPVPTPEEIEKEIVPLLARRR